MGIWSKVYGTLRMELFDYQWWLIPLRVVYYQFVAENPRVQAEGGRSTRWYPTTQTRISNGIIVPREENLHRSSR